MLRRLQRRAEERVVAATLHQQIKQVSGVHGLELLVIRRAPFKMSGNDDAIQVTSLTNNHHGGWNIYPWLAMFINTSMSRHTSAHFRYALARVRKSPKSSHCARSASIQCRKRWDDLTIQLRLRRIRSRSRYLLPVPLSQHSPLPLRNLMIHPHQRIDGINSAFSIIGRRLGRRISSRRFGRWLISRSFALP